MIIIDVHPNLWLLLSSFFHFSLTFDSVYYTNMTLSLDFRCSDLAKRVTALLKESKQNYFMAEEVFHELMDAMGLSDPMGKRPCLIKQPSSNVVAASTLTGGEETTTPPPSPYHEEGTLPRYSCTPYREVAVNSFQRAICSLVRHAPNHHLALKYLCFYLEQIDPPLRTERIETTMLINIIHVFAQERYSIDMAYRALDYINIGLERDILHFSKYHQNCNPRNAKFQDPASVFYSVSRPVLIRLKLEFSDDYRSVQPNTTGRFLRHYLR